MSPTGYGLLILQMDISDFAVVQVFGTTISNRFAGPKKILNENYHYILSCLSFPLICEVQTNSTKPNIILIIGDDIV